ncbi:GMC oxidoreductase [Xylariaceae sp. FL0804]|nr:GMC oxidoreductase [Xylariaceae sp. FL0804]
MAAPTVSISPIALALPPLPSDAYFTEAQWQTLFSMLDAVTPSIVIDSEVTDRKNQLCISEAQCREAYARLSSARAPSYQQFKEYLKARPIDSPAYVAFVKRLVGLVPKSDQQRLGTVLKLLSSKVGSLAVTGYCVPASDQPLHLKETIFQAWDKSWLDTFPLLAEAFLKIGKTSFSTVDPLFLKLSGYRNHEDDYKPGPEFSFNFMQFPAGEEPAIVETDVVIVGSGPGGAVCAKVLAEAGHDVVVVDKGYYFPPAQLPMAPEAASEYLYEGHGFQQSNDGALAWVAGSSWGGGGSINWSASLQPQGFVRQEWADKGLDFFNTQEFQHCLDRVCEFMGVDDAHIRHNYSNQVLLKGATKLGWHAKPVPQNTGGHEHYCGSCFLGCGSGQKQGPNVSWLPAASRAGARFVEGFHVEKVLFEEDGGSKRAVGVVGKWTARGEGGTLESPEGERLQRLVEVRAKKVIVSGGTMQSPLLLLRSGLKNPHIGRNLYLHPVAGLHAAFEEDVNAWEGGILTSVCTSHENQDGKGHGVKLETSVAMPHILFPYHPWESALQFKTDALRFRHMANFIAIARDRDTGRVYPDPVDGRPLVDYTTSSYDRKHLLVGLVSLAKLAYIQGATEIWPRVPGLSSFKRKKKPAAAAPAKSAARGSDSDPNSDFDSDDDDASSVDQGINDADFAAYLGRIERAGLGSARFQFNCAHQMGSCRMAARARDGVVDPRGRVWGVEGLYVADASVFPSASGVNPMVTNMAISDHTARGVSRELKKMKTTRASL